MRAVSVTVGEWLLMLINTPDTLIGDLHEAVETRTLGWYWREVLLAACSTLDRYARRHPVWASWAGTMVLVGVFGAFHVTAAIEWQIVHGRPRSGCVRSCAEPVWLTNEPYAPPMMDASGCVMNDCEVSFPFVLQRLTTIRKCHYRISLS